MKRFILPTLLLLSAIGVNATTYYSIHNGLWTEGLNWSLTPSGEAVGGLLDANSNTFIIQNGNIINFTSYVPSGGASSNIIAVESGTVNSTVDLGSNDFQLELFSDGIVDVSANLYPEYVKLSGNGTITAGGDFSASYFASESAGRKTAITAQNVYFQNYNNHNNLAGTVGNSLTTNIKTSIVGGNVVIDNYDDNASSALTITDGNLSINDASPTINGIIDVNNGELLLPSTYSYTIYGKLEAEMHSDYSFESSSRIFNIEQGGILRLYGNGTNMITHPSNLAVTGFRVKEGGKLELIDLDYEQRGYNNYNINGIFSITDGNFHQYGGNITIEQKGKLMLQDSDKPVLPADIDKGIFNMYWGSKVLNNYGMFLAEKYETHNSGNNQFNNYEIMFIKSFITDNNDNKLNVYDKNSSATAEIDNTEYLKEETAVPLSYYSGSYLYYCTEEDDFGDIYKDANASVFMPTGADGLPGSVEAFPNVQTCFDQFYGEISVILPITLASFSLQQHTDGVKLAWATSSEKDNDFFSVYHSADGKVYDFIGEVSGSGNSSSLNAYSLIDRNPNKGTNYYKLSQTDLDGTVTEFPPASIIYGDEVMSVSLFPTVASRGSYVSLEFNKETEYVAELVNSEGVVIARGNSDQLHSYFFLRSDLSQGDYFMRIITDKRTFVEPLIVK